MKTQNAKQSYVKELAAVSQDLQDLAITARTLGRDLNRLAYKLKKRASRKHWRMKGETRTP
jgi:hypothetical protein